MSPALTIQAEEQMLSMKVEYDDKKLAVKELERQKKKLDEKLKPLEELKKDSNVMHRAAVEELKAKTAQTGAVSIKVDELQDVIEERRAAIKGVEGQLKKIRLEREKVEELIKRDEEAEEVTRQKIETQFNQPADQVVKQMREEAAKAQAAQLVRRPGLRRQGSRHRQDELAAPKARGGSCAQGPPPAVREPQRGLASRPRLSLRPRWRALHSLDRHRRRSTTPATRWRTTSARAATCSRTCRLLNATWTSSMT